MNEPRRLKDSAGSSQRLLDSASLDKPREASRERVAALMSTESAFSRSSSQPSSKRGALRTFATWAAIGAAASVALGFALTSFSPGSKSAPHVAATPLALTAEPSEIAPELPQRVEPWAEAPAAGQRSAADLVDFERAREAITRGDGAAALTALDVFGASRAFPDLRDEVTVLRVQALDLSGQRAQAKQLAQEFAREHPHHPLRSRVAPLGL